MFIALNNCMPSWFDSVTRHLRLTATIFWHRWDLCLRKQIKLYYFNYISFSLWAIIHFILLKAFLIVFNWKASSLRVYCSALWKFFGAKVKANGKAHAEKQCTFAFSFLIAIIIYHATNESESYTEIQLWLRIPKRKFLTLWMS